MRIVVASVTALFVALVAVLASGLASRPAPPDTRIESGYRTETPLCRIDDERLTSISGTAVLMGQVWVADDQGATIYRLDGSCQVAEAVDLAPLLAARKVTLRDTEDLAVSPDGWLWLADTGGNRSPRSRVQLVGWNPLYPKRTKVVTVDYPSGTYDTEALLVGSEGRAVLVTKDEFRPATVFSTAEALVDGTEVPLVRRGTLDLGTAGGGGRARTVTGGAVAPSGVDVVLRTYSGAWEYDVVDGDIPTALVDGTPRPVPLPTSRQGEAIAYSEDGLTLLMTTEGSSSALDRVSITRRLVEVP